MNLPKKYVLTGGPCTGKSSLINLFKKMGYQTVQEAAAIIMREEREKGKEVPWEDLNCFQSRVLNKQLEFENKLDPIPIAFVDRGTLDGMAYFKLFEKTPPHELFQKALENRYDGIFLLDFLPFYNKNKIRTESFLTAKKIHAFLKKTYKNAGYNVIEVPPLNLQARASFIYKRTEEIAVKGFSIVEKVWGQ